MGQTGARYRGREVPVLTGGDDPLAVRGPVWGKERSLVRVSTKLGMDTGISFLGDGHFNGYRRGGDLCRARAPRR